MENRRFTLEDTSDPQKILQMVSDVKEKTEAFYCNLFDNDHGDTHVVIQWKGKKTLTCIDMIQLQEIVCFDDWDASYDAERDILKLRVFLPDDEE